MIRQLFYMGGLLLSSCLAGQATFSSGTYSQDFGTANIAAWTDNTTFPGWYLGTGSSGTFQGTINITAASPSNNGGLYMYTCNGVADLKLGTRPANTPAGGPCDGTPTTCGFGLGLRLQNNFGLPIVAMKVDFDWYQLSLAQNGNVGNTMLFYYKTGAGPLTSVSNTVTTGTHLAALDFTAPQSSAVVGSGQINGYPCTQTGHNSNCFVISVPAGNEIMLAWWDPNNSNNDPHLAIDNVVVTAYSDNSCLTVLPVELFSFTANPEDGKVLLNWETASETNNDFFTVERASDHEGFSPLATVNGNGTCTYMHAYNAVDFSPFPGNNYYRLRQTDYNGASTVSGIVAVNMNDISPGFYSKVARCESGLCYSVKDWNSPVEMKIYDGIGRLLFTKQLQPDDNGSIPFDENKAGMLVVTFTSADHASVLKIMP